MLWPRLDAARIAAPRPELTHPYQRQLEDKSLDIVACPPGPRPRAESIRRVEAGKDVSPNKPMARRWETVSDGRCVRARTVCSSTQLGGVRSCFQVREIVDSGALGGRPLMNCLVARQKGSPYPRRRFGQADWDQWWGPRAQAAVRARRSSPGLVLGLRGGYCRPRQVHIQDAVISRFPGTPPWPLTAARQSRREQIPHSSHSRSSIPTPGSLKPSVHLRIAAGTQPRAPTDSRQRGAPRPGGTPFCLYKRTARLDCKPEAAVRIPGAIENAVPRALFRALP